MQAPLRTSIGLFQHALWFFCAVCAKARTYSRAGVLLFSDGSNAAIGRSTFARPLRPLRPGAGIGTVSSPVGSIP